MAEAKRRLEAVRCKRTTLVPTEEVERELDELILDAPRPAAQVEVVLAVKHHKRHPDYWRAR